jgi:protein-S-isoprenylcysteine O-methyltransferase Ste14
MPNRYQKLFGVGPVGLLIFAALFVLAWFTDRTAGPFSVFAWPRVAMIVGIVFIGLWICWHAWAVHTIRMWWFKDQLCTEGPFRFVRHPMYAGATFLAGFGVAFLLNSWAAILCPLAVYPILSVLVLKEEKMMEEVFGAEYERYAARTGRLIPKLF